MNSGGNFYGNSAEVKENVWPKPDNYSLLLYATRDIEEGEEILMNYILYTPRNYWEVGL